MPDVPKPSLIIGEKTSSDFEKNFSFSLKSYSPIIILKHEDVESVWYGGKSYCRVISFFRATTASVFFSFFFFIHFGFLGSFLLFLFDCRCRKRKKRIFFSRQGVSLPILVQGRRSTTGQAPRKCTKKHSINGPENGTINNKTTRKSNKTQTKEEEHLVPSASSKRKKKKESL